MIIGSPVYLITEPGFEGLDLGERSRLRHPQQSLHRVKVYVTTTKYIHIKSTSTTVYVPSSDLGLSHPLSREGVRGWGTSNFNDWRKSLALCYSVVTIVLMNKKV
jgi:hypothetical protein